MLYSMKWKKALHCLRDRTQHYGLDLLAGNSWLRHSHHRIRLNRWVVSEGRYHQREKRAQQLCLILIPFNQDLLRLKALNHTHQPLNGLLKTHSTLPWLILQRMNMSLTVVPISHVHFIHCWLIISSEVIHSWHQRLDVPRPTKNDAQDNSL